MSISHGGPGGADPTRAFIFAALGGFTCSICAPSSWTAEEVEAFANRETNSEGWKSVNKSELGLGSPTPNPCNTTPDRQHHFMLHYD